MPEFSLVFTKAFEDDVLRLELLLQRQIAKKVQELKWRPLLGKRLVGHPYWSLHIGAHRVIYRINTHDRVIELLAVLERKHEYRELGKL